MKPYLKFSFLFISLFFSTQIIHAQGYLKVNGKHIENDNDKNFILKGMGLGGYMLQEGYMFQLGFLGQQHKIREKITQFAGKEKADDFYNKWLQYHTTKADIDSMASWGFNSIRLPMHFDLFTLPVKDEPVKGKNTWLPRGFQMVDSLLKWCKQNKIYLILDLHAAPGGQGNDLPISDRYPDEPSLWQSPENQAKTIALWKKLARRYAKEPYIGGYDILNETNWGFDNANDSRGIGEKRNIPLRDLFIKITKAIRSVDKKHIIFLEGNGFANNYNGMFPLWDNNLVISFHKYGNFTTQNTIQNFLDYREKYNVPLWLGETGENSNTWFTHNIQLMENNDIGWCWWQLKKMGINNPLEIKHPENYQLFLDFCEGKAAKPDEATAGKIMDDFLNNIKIENNIYHPDVIDAMFRQVNSNATLPFKENVVDEKITINAVDFDLGGNGFAYKDADTASYMYTPGVKTQGNRGRKYRNDGVDIQENSKGEPYVFSIEAGEWLLFTIDVQQAGTYDFSCTLSPVKGGGSFTLYNFDKPISEEIKVPISENLNDFFTTTLSSIQLNKGVNKLKIFFNEGGFYFKSFGLTLKK